MAPRTTDRQMSLSSGSNVSSLDQHLDILYPLARILAGSGDAEALIQRVYEQAAEVPPRERPEDQRAWLLRLLIEVRNGSLDADRKEVDPGEGTSFTDDPFRREVARQTAERVLPVAFAACSLQERFLLALDVLGNPSDEVLAETLDVSATAARTARDDAHSALRAALRDALTGPERMLVDVALTEETLREALHDLLATRLEPVPTALRSKVVSTLEQERPARDPERATPSFPRRVFSTISAYRPSISTMRRGVIGLVFLAVAVAGLAGLFYGVQPEPNSSSDLIDLSTQQSNAVRPLLSTEDPSEAENYVQSTWNRRISVPSIDRAQLQGVGRSRVAEEVDVPVLLYTDTADSSRIAAFIYSYALLDQLDPQVSLDVDLRDQLARNERLVVRAHPEDGAVLWRHRDDIFVVVAPTADPKGLRPRIQP